MKFIKSKKALVLLAVAVTAVVAAVAGYAYWTAGGSGNGTASAGSTSALTVNQTSVLDAMYPGDSPQTLSGDFDNTNSGPIYVGTVTASISSVTGPNITADTPCDASDYTLSDAAMTVDAEVPAGSGQGAWTGATLQFNDKTDANQNGCKGATVHLHYAIS